ncbi:hypothetical protein N9917_01205 [Deltaproteobacteria bacterium]|nr:hypothetical protein [Deltaproteobacteria bacterium]
MSEKPLVDEERIRAVYEDLAKMEVSLDRDPLIYGPKRLNEKTAIIRQFLTRTERIFLSVSQDLAILKRKHRLAETDFRLLEQDLLANDPNVRAGRSVKDREALAHVKLRDEVENITELASAINDLDASLTVVKAKRTDLKDVQRALRDQMKLCQEEIHLGNNWGSRLPPGNKDPIDPSLVGTTANVNETINDLIGDVEGEIDLARADGTWVEEEVDVDELLEVDEVDLPDEEDDPDEVEAAEETVDDVEIMAAVAGIDDILAAEEPPEPEPESLTVVEALDKTQEIADSVVPKVAKSEPEPEVETSEPEPIETPPTSVEPETVAVELSKSEEPVSSDDADDMGVDELLADMMGDAPTPTPEPTPAPEPEPEVEAPRQEAEEPPPEPEPKAAPPKPEVGPTEGELAEIKAERVVLVPETPPVQDNLIDLEARRTKKEALPASASTKDTEAFLDTLDLTPPPTARSAGAADETLDLEALIGMFK